MLLCCTFYVFLCVFVNKGFCIYNFIKCFCSKLLLEFVVLLHWFISVQFIWLEYIHGSVVYLIKTHQNISPITDSVSKQLRLGSWNWNISEKSGKPIWLQNWWATIGAIMLPVEMNNSAEYAPNIVVYVNWNTNTMNIYKLLYY